MLEIIHLVYCLVFLFVSISDIICYKRLCNDIQRLDGEIERLMQRIYILEHRGDEI